MYTYYNYEYSRSIFYLPQKKYRWSIDVFKQFQTYFEESKDVKKLTESEDFWKVGRQKELGFT